MKHFFWAMFSLSAAMFVLGGFFIAMPTANATNVPAEVSFAITEPTASASLNTNLTWIAALFTYGNTFCSAAGTLSLQNATCLAIVATPGLSVQKMPTCADPTFAITIPNCTTKDTILFGINASPIATGIASLNVTSPTVLGQGNTLDVYSYGGKYTITPASGLEMVAPAQQNTSPAEGMASSAATVENGSLVDTISPTETATIDANPANISGSSKWDITSAWLQQNWAWIFWILLLILIFWYLYDDHQSHIENNQ